MAPNQSLEVQMAPNRSQIIPNQALEGQIIPNRALTGSTNGSKPSAGGPGALNRSKFEVTAVCSYFSTESQ